MTHTRCSRSELYRGTGPDGTPATWGLRMFNGRDEQLMTVMLPNLLLTDIQGILDPPGYDRLAAWDSLRATCLGLESDPFDRSGKGFARTR